MKLLPWIINKPIEAYTTLAYDGESHFGYEL